jgi:hypothetical protein
MFRCGEQASPIFEGVVEIWINSQPCKRHNLTIWHTQAKTAPRVVIVYDTVKESGWVLPHPSTVFHAYASADTPWVARTLSHCTPVNWGNVSSNSAPHNATQFVGPYESRMRQYTTQSLLIRTQLTRALINISRGYNLGALNFKSAFP